MSNNNNNNNNGAKQLVLQQLFPTADVNILKMYLEQSNYSLDQTIALLLETGVSMSTTGTNNNANEQPDVNRKRLMPITVKEKNNNKRAISASSLSSSGLPTARNNNNNNNNNNWENLLQSGSIFLNRKDQAEIVIHRSDHSILAINLNNIKEIHMYNLDRLDANYRPYKTMEDLKPYCYGPFYIDRSYGYSDRFMNWLQSCWQSIFGINNVIPVFCTTQQEEEFRNIDILKQNNDESNNNDQIDFTHRHYFWLVSYKSITVEKDVHGAARNIGLKFHKGLGKNLQHYNLYIVERSTNILQHVENVEIKDEIKDDNKDENEIKNDNNDILMIENEKLVEEEIDLKQESSELNIITEDQEMKQENPELNIITVDSKIKHEEIQQEETKQEIQQQEIKQEEIKQESNTISIEEKKEMNLYNKSNYSTSPLYEKYMQHSILNLTRLKWIYEIQPSAGSHYSHMSNRTLQGINNMINIFTANRLNLSVDPFPFTSNDFTYDKIMALKNLQPLFSTQFPEFYPVLNELSQDPTILANQCFLKNVTLSSEQIATIFDLIQKDQTPYSGLWSTTISIYNAQGRRFIYDYARDALHQPDEITMDRRAFFNVGEVGAGKTLTTGAAIQFDIHKNNLWNLQGEERYKQIPNNLKKYLEDYASNFKPKLNIKKNGENKNKDEKENKSNKNKKNDTKNKNNISGSTQSNNQTPPPPTNNSSQMEKLLSLVKGKVNKFASLNNNSKIQIKVTPPAANIKVELPCTLIVCKPSLIPNWSTEIEEHFDPRLKVLVAYGKSQKRVTLKDLLSHHVVITSYETFAKGNQFSVPLDRIVFRRVVCDEAHELRTGNTLINHRLNETSSKRWGFLTGTIVVALLKDISPLIKISNVNIVKQRKASKHSRNEYVDEHQYGSQDPAYFAILANLSVRCSKKNVLQLQNYTRTTNRIMVNFTEEERKVYDELLQQNKLIVRSLPLNEAIPRRHCLNNMRKVCSYYSITDEERQIVLQEIQRLEQVRIAGPVAYTSNIIRNSLSEDFTTIFDVTKHGTATDFAIQCRTEDCVVCLENLSNGECVQVKKCRHVFHSQCLEGVVRALSINCPICRSRIGLGDIQKPNFPPELVEDISSEEDEKMDLVENIQELKEVKEDIIVDDSGNITAPSQGGIIFKSKINALINVLKTRKNTPGQEMDKCLIFSSFPDTLKQLKIELDKAGILCLSLNCSASSRGRLLKKFKQDERYTALLLNPNICAGLTLTVANHNEFFDVIDNIQLKAQAVARLDRLSQKKNITTNDYVMSNSIEQKLMELNDRRQMATSSINSGFGVVVPRSSSTFSDSNQLSSSDMNSLFM